MPQQPELYQIEVKANLIKVAFNPSEGWNVTVDLDAMELGKGKQNSPEKRERAGLALTALESMGVTIGAHDTFGRVDLVAERSGELHLVEVEGRSSRQKEQAMYSALGQLLLTMRWWHPKTKYGLAAPDSRAWLNQLRKIPPQVTERLDLVLYLVNKGECTCFDPGEEIAVHGRV